MKARVIGVAALLFAASTWALGQECVVNISTGYDQELDLILAEGANDDDYYVDRGTGAGLEPTWTRGASQGFPIPPWVVGDDQSLWISSTSDTNDHPGNYTFEISVVVPDGVVASKLAIAGEWTGDDAVTDVIINGTSTGIGTQGFDAMHAFPINAGIGLFQDDTNVIQFVVNNGSSADPNPVGLRVKACLVEASPIDWDYDISTGFDEDALVILPNGANDPDYILTGPAGSGIGPGPAVVINDTGFPIPPWLGSTIQSKWIGPQADSNGPAGDYTYTIEVNLPASVNAALSVLSGGFASDNEVVDILVNGTSTGATGAGFGALTALPSAASRGLFVTGKNTVSFVVRNDPDPGPTGLRVAGEVMTCPSGTPEVLSNLFALDTGFDDASGATIANTLADENYTVLGPPGTGLCLDEAVVIDDALPPIADGAWVRSTAQSKWIGVAADPNGPPGRYAFEMTVTLPAGYDAASARLVGSWTTDNNAPDILINGTSAGIAGAGGFGAFQPFPAGAGQGLFVPGENKVTFLVENAGTAANPVGLRVEAVVGIEDPRPSDVSTGINVRGIGALPGGFDDPRYIVTGPAGSGIGPKPAVTVTEDGDPIPPWAANSSASQWIGLDGSDSAGPAGTYSYKMSFTLGPEVNPYRAVLAGRWAAAGRGTDVLLNGTSLGLTAAGPGSFTDFPAGAGRRAFVAGANTLEFLVENLSAGSTGIRVEAKVDIVTEANPYDISTGFDQVTGAVIPEGTPDDQYMMTTPTPGDPEPAWVVNGAPVPPWAPNTASSRWVGTAELSSNGEPGQYVFKVFVTLPAEGVSDAYIEGGWAIDDGSDDVRVNGNSLGIPSVLGLAGLTMFPPEAGKGLFQEGSNLIEFVVTNAGTVANPVGLRVDAVIVLPGGPPPVRFIRGDVDGKAPINITDAIYGLGFLFLGGPPPPCHDALDVNDDGTANITDPINLLNYLFLGGTAPQAPFPNCGVDSDKPDTVPCAASHVVCQ